LISVEQALDSVLNSVAVLEPEERPILDGLGQILAEDIYADINVPQHDNSAMDGYALLAEDSRGASMKQPKLLWVIETAPAGYIAKREVMPGTAIRIMTGAPIPQGADCVVRFEDTDEMCRQQPATEIGITKEVAMGSYIRQAGEDIVKGTKVLGQGMLVRPSEVGVLASLGISKVKVIRQPKVAILSTGDEISDINEPLLPGKIYNSNTYSLAALIKSYGGIPVVLGVAKDNEESVLANIRQGLDADLLLTSGGINTGDYDLVKNFLATQGEINFCSVRMKPGKPLAFGMIEGVNKAGKRRTVPHFGLPGNPVSCMVTCELFVRPAILKMMGSKDLFKPAIEAIMQNSRRDSCGTRTFARAVVSKQDGQYYAQVTDHQKSGMLISMSLANGLVIIPEDKDGVGPGDKVQVMMLG
jgi:molybdopterin molybdotransferase